MADVTPTPTPCTCEEHQVTIIQSDLDSASGNTDSNLDGVVFWITTNCSGVYEEIPFYDAGVFDGFCVCQETSFYYWKDNSAIQGYSFADPIGPCNPATPTQTPTLPESPTQTPTPSTTPPVTYYYYSGLLCGAVSFLKYFRSTNPNLADHCPVVYAWCDTCGGGSYQCFDNISPSAVYNTNDVIECYETCECCQGLCPTPTQTETLPLTPTQTETPPSTPTQTPTPSITASPTQTPTPSITASPTQTPTPSITASQTQTQTQTPTPSITASQTQTQTQTSSPTPSTTPCVEGCVEYVNVNVTFAGTIAYLDCNGVTQYQSVSVGAQSVGVGTCVNKDSLAGSAAFTVVLNGPCCGVIPATPSQTPTNTITPTQTPTITASPTQSPTNTPTTTPTTTITATPSSTPLVCGSGYTTGNHYYYDCCGNLVTGSAIETLVALDYTKPYVGIVLLNEPASVLCATPTNTPTQSATPTPSITPSVTPSPTLTPTITPTTSMTPSSPEVYVRENNCEVVTIFPMGIQCNVVNPNTSTSQDGVVSLIITGGSAPYTITWDNGQIGQTLVGMQQGSYGVTVVDFYGDYTANTVCSIFAPSPTPTASVTVTPTMTPSPVYPNLCFFVDYGVGAVIGPLQFNWIGSFNGKPQWSYFNGVTTTYLRWNIELSRWQMYDWTSTGTLVSFVTTNIPTTGWQSEGNPQQAVVTVTEGTCPQSAPLTIRITTDPTTCGDVAPYDGGITISAVGGTAPYTYSIDNGQTFSSANVFSQLRNGNYTVVVRDSAGSTISRQATVTADYSTVSYQVYVNTSGVTQISEYNYQSSWCVEVNPPLPVGVTLSFDLSVSESKIIDQPGSGVSVPSTTVKKNDVAVTTTNITTSDNTTTRPNCDPYTRFEENRTALYPLTMQRGDIISGTSVSLITLTTPEIGPNGCATRVEQNTVVFAQSPILTNCNCCDISNLKVYGGIPRHIVQYSNSGGGQAPPTVNTSYLSVPGSNICDVCSLRRIPTPVFNYDNTISVGTVFYTVNTEGVLSSPLNGGFSYYKIFWGGSEPTDYDVVQIDDNGVITSLVDCQTECFTYFEFPGSIWGPNTGSLYSNCNPLSFGPLCVVYENTSGTPLLGYPYIFINNMNYDINPETGYVIGISPIQQ